MEQTKHNYQLVGKKIQDEIKKSMEEIRSHIKSLDQHCMESIYYADTDRLFDLNQLVELKEQLEKIAEDLLLQNGLIADMWGYGLYLLDEDPGYVEEMQNKIEKLAKG
jgi:hypothetical protein